MSDIKPVGQLKPVETGIKPVGQLNPVQSNLSPIGQLKEGDPNTILPTYTKPIDRQVDSAIDFIKQKGGRNGSTIMDSELDVLKDVLKDTRATEDQRKRAIATIQGYDSKHDDNNTMYYNKLEDNGVYVPTALAYGEKPPKGYKVASVWGNQNQSNNDNALTDISKSIFNGVIGAVEGVIDVAQIGKTLITGEESKYLNKLGNTAEALKFNKDEDLSKSVYDMSNIKTFSDLLDSKRFDVSPQALWGTLNGVVESFVGFYGGGKGPSTAIKGVKGFSQGLKGVAKEVIEDGIIKNRILLSKPEQISSILAGSFAIQVGDVYDSAKEAGLEGRDAAGVATLIGGALASIDAASGLDGKIMSSIFNNEKKNTLKSVIKEVVKDLPKDKSGNITPEAMKELFARTTVSYAKIAKNGAKEVVKDVLQEGGQEAAQDFTQKAGEQLWDKLSSEDKAKFGSNAFSAESFGSYLNSFASGLVGGAPMSLVNEMIKSKHDEQSINAYERVKEGPEAVTALKTDLGQALKNNDINQSEYDQAIFKIDSYDKYHQETKGVNLKPEDEKKAFELSFQIQGLKTEIPTNENEISKLDPIPRSKVESKQKQVKELQSELNDIIRQGEIKGEPVVPKKEEERIQKEKEKESKANETKPTPKETRVPKPRVAKVDLEDSEGTTEVKVGSEYKKEPKLPKQPDLKDETRTYDTIDNETFNHTRFPSRTKFKMVVDKLSKFQNKEMSGVIKKKSYKYYDKVSKQWTPNSILEVELEDGKRIRFASSQYHDSKTEEGFRSHTRNERLLGNEEGVPVGLKLIDINNPFGLPTKEGYIPGKKVLKIYNKRTGQFLSWAKETHKGKSDSKKEDGSLVTTAEEGDILKTLEGQRYNEDIKGNEGDIARLIAPKPKPTPTERASDATDKIVEEAKTKVKEQGLNKRRLEIFELLKDVKKLRNNEERELNKELENILLELSESKEKVINAGSNQGELFQKVSQRKGDFSKVVEVISKAFNNKHIKVVEDANQFKGEQSTVAGKVSSDGKFIYINPNYAGLDTPIHEGGHILIDAMGYNNKVIQSAIKQLRGTDLYSETKERYPELSEQELDKEVLAEAIGREGADIFDSVADRSKFKTYLDYIFDWLKQKLGMDKNIAKSLAKQIIGGVKTKNIEGTNTGKEQLQKVNEPKQKNPLGARPLKFEQYAAEHGFSYEKETDKIEEASYLLKEAQDEYDIAKENAEVANTDEEAEPLEKILAEKEVALKAAKKNFAIKGKRTFEYKKYRKDFNEIQKLMAEKELSDYTTEELQDLISMLHGFDNKAATSVRNEAMVKLALEAIRRQLKISGKHEAFIAELAKSTDITPLQRRILHHSHFSEKNPDGQAISLAFSNAIMDKLIDANTRKATHEKLGQKVIAEENKKLGIIGAQTNRFSSDSAKYFEWMSDKDGNLMTIDEAKAKGLSEAKINYLKFTRETIADYRGQLEENNFENAVMQAIRIDKGFMEAYKSEGLLPAFSYYLGGGANNLGKVRIEHNGQIKSYSEIEKEILATANRKSITSMAKALFDLLVANIKARYQLKKGFNVDEKENPLELKGEAEYSLNEKGQLVSKFDKPRAKDRGYSKDFYKAMNQFIDESAHTKHISKIMPLVDSVEYLNKNGYMDEGYVIKPNVAKWIEDWKKLHIFKEQHVNDPVLDASIKAMRNLVASTTMWFNIPANVLNVFMGNYSNWRQENGKVVALGNKRLFGGNAKNRAYGLDLIKKYNLVNQDYDSNATMKAGSILSKIATWGTKVGEYQIQGSLGLGLLTEDEFNSFEYTKDKYGNEVLTVKEGVDEAKIKAKMIQIKNRVTDIQGKYPDEDRRNIMKGEIGKAAFQFKVWMPDWFKERFGAKYINAYGQEKEGTFRQLMRTGIKEMYADLKKGDFKNIYKNNPSFMSNLKGLATIGTLIALSHMDDDDEEIKKGSLTFQNALSQVLFILDLEQDKYMVSNHIAALGKTKDLISAFEALVTLDEKAIDKVKRVIPGNKITKAYELGKKVID